MVGGTKSEPTFGILDTNRRGVDLRHCGLYEPGLARALPRLCDAVSALGLTPYDVNTRSGEFKHLIVTHAPSGDLMARFVLRSPGQLPRLERAIPELQEAIPGLRVVSINEQPEHKAILAGPREHVLTEEDSLPLQVGPVTVFLRPESFFQTNTAIAAQLYSQAARWVHGSGADTLWDLYCGVGGFGLSVGAQAPVRVVGVEIEPAAITGAQRSAAAVEARNPLSSFDFRVGDASTILRNEQPADVVLVNPPRRGIGSLADWLNSSGVEQIIYSSCNVTSLQADLERLTSYRATAVRAYDMFPQTRHHEVLVQLVRQPTASRSCG